METHFYSLFKQQKNSLSITEANRYHALNDFHYHVETELIYIIEGEGTLLLGDKLIRVSGDMLILIGKNTPHMFKFDTFTYQDDLMQRGKIPLQVQLLTLHFDPNIWGDAFMKLPENETMSNLFTEAAKGLHIEGGEKKSVIELMSKLLSAPAYDHFSILMNLFNTIALGKEHQFLAETPDAETLNKTDEKRLSKVYIYTLNNFTRAVKLKDVADIVYMCPNAFCRYFKLRTNKSYFEFLIEIRIDYACRLLREKDYSTAVICYNSGFGNISNFNRHFKALTGKTPLEYRKNPGSSLAAFPFAKIN
jgi:AraC-like DNA-binding protein